MQSFVDAAIAGSIACGQALCKDVFRRRHQDCHDVSVAPADRANDRPRYVADDRPSRLDIEIDRQRNSIVVAVRAPPECEGAPHRRLLESGFGHDIVVLEGGGGPRTTRAEDDRGIIAASSAGARDQVSLPAPLGPTTSTNRPGPIKRERLDSNRSVLAIRLMPRDGLRATRFEPRERRPQDARG